MGEEVICEYSRNRDEELRVDSSEEDRGDRRRCALKQPYPCGRSYTHGGTENLEEI